MKNIINIYCIKLYKPKFSLPEILYCQKETLKTIIAESTHKSNYYTAIILRFSLEYDMCDNAYRTRSFSSSDVDCRTELEKSFDYTSA